MGCFSSSAFLFLPALSSALLSPTTSLQAFTSIGKPQDGCLLCALAHMALDKIILWINNISMVCGRANQLSRVIRTNDLVGIIIHVNVPYPIFCVCIIFLVIHVKFSLCVLFCSNLFKIGLLLDKRSQIPSIYLNLVK